MKPDRKVELQTDRKAPTRPPRRSADSGTSATPPRPVTVHVTIEGAGGFKRLAAALRERRVKAMRQQSGWNPYNMPPDAGFDVPDWLFVACCLAVVALIVLGMVL